MGRASVLSGIMRRILFSQALTTPPPSEKLFDFNIADEANIMEDLT